ncbi:MAG: type IV toxin-antitoxin system AbiEi family antitoxin [Fibrobacteria bacterium]
MNIANFVNIENLSGPALERALAQELETRLAAIPWLRGWKVQLTSGSADPGFDILATLPLPSGGKAALCIECKRELRPRAFRMLSERRIHPPGRPDIIIPVLAMPWVSPGMAAVCQANKWSWFDLAGNHFIDVPGLLQLSHTGNEPAHARPRPSANLGTAEAARIIRALLAAPSIGKPWTQRELREACSPEVSIGLVNKVVRHLREEDVLSPGDDEGFRMRDPMKLLAAWRDAYRFKRHSRIGYFTLMQGKTLQSALAQLGARAAGGAAYAVFSAAENQAPHVRQPKTWLYVRSRDLSLLEKLAEAKTVDSGENMVVLVPEDEGVFYSGEGADKQAGRLGCTNIIQTYVDLWHAGGRGQEAAEALLNQRIKPDWKRQGFPV